MGNQYVVFAKDSGRHVRNALDVWKGISLFLWGLVGVFFECFQLFLLCVAVFANEIDGVVVFHEYVVEVFAFFFFDLNCVAVSFNSIV